MSSCLSGPSPVARRAPSRGKEGRQGLSRLVMKFGGTSVADMERIRRVARLVTAQVKSGAGRWPVVSAMAERLVELVAWTDGAGQAAPGLPDSDDEYDVVVASGEQVSAGLLAMTLRNMGVHAKSWLAWQIPILTDDAHGKARIADVIPDKLEAAMAAGIVPVIAGFQGIDDEQPADDAGPRRRRSVGRGRGGGPGRGVQHLYGRRRRLHH